SASWRVGIGPAVRPLGRLSPREFPRAGADAVATALTDNDGHRRGPTVSFEPGDFKRRSAPAFCGAKNKTSGQSKTSGHARKFFTNVRFTTMNAPVRLRVSIGNYPYVLPLKDGSVKSERLALEFIDVDPLNETFRRMIRDHEFDVSEMALT